MGLTEQQKAAVERARAALGTKRTGVIDCQPREPAFWAGWLDLTLTELLDALDEDEGDLQ
jgi:hypothetical protein